jgi:hypothetical protein
MAYRTFFHGRIALAGAAQVWNAFAPFKVKFHAWLVIRCKRIYNFLCSILVLHQLLYVLFTLHGIFMHFLELTY